MKTLTISLVLAFTAFSTLQAQRTHGGHGGTFQGFDREREVGEGRIDYVFCTEGVEVLKHGVPTDSKNKRYPSDHFPVVTKLVIE